MRKFALSLVLCLSLGIPLFTRSWGMKPQASPLAKSAQKVFMERCFKCHGANGQTDAEGVFVNNRNLLVKSKVLVPGDVNSKLLQKVESGAMPPSGKLPAEEIATLHEWVVNNAPDWQAGEAAPAKRKFLAESDLISSVTQDLESAPERDRKYLRYYSIAHLYNADVSDEELQGYRVGLSKLLNSLSWAREIHTPVAIDSAKTLLRIDLRDYDWSAETWASIISYYPYGYKSAKSDAITSLSGAVVPYVRADWFVEKASLPPLYHIILKLPDTIDGLENLLKVDVARRIEEEKQVCRAGLRKSGVSANNRVVERHVTDYGAYWKSYDFSSSEGEQNIFINPLDLKPAGGEMIFNLPNHMQAYFIVGKGGKRLDAAPIDIVSDRNHPDEPVVRTGRSCMSCHYGGIKDAKDGIRAVVEKLDNAAYDRNKVLAIYRPQEGVDSFIKEDSDRFQGAVRLSGGEPAANVGVEPINALSRKFKGDLSIKLAASEAGLSVEELQKRIGKSARLQQLGYAQLLVDDGGMKRDAWESYFGDLVQEALLGDYLKPSAQPVEVAKAAQPSDPKPVRGGSLGMIKSKTGLDCVAIPGGTFKMGGKYEQPIRSVKVSGFTMSVNVVTVAQYKRFCDATGKAMPPEPEYPAGNKFNAGWSKLDHPIVNVSWDDAKAYCAWVSRETGLECDLPREAEWEYAARGGLEGKEFPWGDGFSLFKLHASKSVDGDAGGTAPVGSYPANGYGLRDMAGNVWEWCADYYQFGYNPNDTDNPKGPPTGEQGMRVLRGGSWYYFHPDRFRCAYRSGYFPTIRDGHYGFRVVFRGL